MSRPGGLQDALASAKRPRLTSRVRQNELVKTGRIFALIVSVALSASACSGAGSTSASSTSTSPSSGSPSSTESSGSNAPTSGGTSASAPSVNDAQQIVPAPVAGATTTQGKVGTVANTTGIDGVVAFDTTGYPAPAGNPGPTALTHDHVPGPVTYSVTPPVGGPHNSVWANAGVYTKAIPTERGVHTMEHGAVWITYRPDLSADQVATLVALVEKQSVLDEGDGMGNRYVLMSPWASSDLSSPVVISSWGYQLKVGKADDPRLEKFIQTFRNSTKYTPEAGSPVDGIPTGTGGNPATAGSQVPNPTGSYPSN